MQIVSAIGRPLRRIQRADCRAALPFRVPPFHGGIPVVHKIPAITDTLNALAVRSGLTSEDLVVDFPNRQSVY